MCVRMQREILLLSLSLQSSSPSFRRVVIRPSVRSTTGSQLAAVISQSRLANYDEWPIIRPGCLSSSSLSILVGTHSMHAWVGSHTVT